MGGRAVWGSIAATVVLSGASILWGGCSLERVSFAGASRDASAIDAGAGDAGVVGACVPRCADTVAIRCVGTSTVEEDCAPRGARCAMTDGDATCVARTCEPLRTRCDGDVLYTCDADGAHEAPTTCEHGCSEGACVTEAPSCVWSGEIVDEGSYTIDLCGRTDDHRVRADQCEGAASNGEDAQVRLFVSQRRRLRLDLRDVDGPGGVDTVLSLLRRCGDVQSEIECANDVACADADDDLKATPCESGRQPRQSRLELELDPGTYYLLLDSQNRGSFGCGRVELRVRVMN
ncbi:hypothetical protein [Sandaracinus amylolyticus]|uniref:hypothetical protein n=1 Tax=Sandaracinus amylolyticus TaxID=927083 RepID=UPI001969F2ED|nr:hypothetical protein [Sandaracinus amylolyticus]